MDPEGGSQKATLVALVVVVVVVIVGVVVISSLKIHKAFLIRSATKLCIHIRAHVPHRVLAQIFSCRNAIISVIKVCFMLSI